MSYERVSMYDDDDDEKNNVCTSSSMFMFRCTAYRIHKHEERNVSCSYLKLSAIFRYIYISSCYVIHLSTLLKGIFLIKRKKYFEEICKRNGTNSYERNFCQQIFSR